MPKSTRQRLIDTKPSTRKSGAYASASGSGSGAPVPTHALDGPYHTGTLSDAQAPQFLKTDGSRALTGNLAVNSGVTIDGVDLSAHVTDTGAHHAAFVGLEDDAGTTISPAADYRIQVLGGDGLTSTAGANALTLAVDSSVVRTTRNIVAGDGLTGGGALSADVTLNVNPGAGIEIVSDAVRVNQGYAFNWTAQHTFSAGLTSNGDVIALQDLYVGGSTPSSATLFVDSSLQSVGINRQPDSQFSLDISGPARADWWVGPHALQLEDAEMIVHFDGPRPYETDFSGTAVGHMGQVPTEYGGVIYRPGKFGKAVQIAESTTNLLLNPSFEISGYWSGTDTITYNVPGGVYGDYCAKVDYAAGSATTLYQDYATSVAVGSSWTGSAHVWGQGSNVGKSVQVLVYILNGGSVVEYTSATFTLTDTPQRISVTHTATAAGDSVRFRVQVLSTTGTTFYIDACQLEQKPYPTPYCDGSLGPGHSWSGTAHASTSTRDVASMRWDWTDITEDTPWTVMARLRDPYVDWDYSSRSTASYIWSIRCNADTDSITLYCSGTNAQQIEIRWRTGGTEHYPSFTMPADDAWHHVAVSYDPATQALNYYVDGVSAGSYAATKWSGHDGAGRFQLGMAAWSSYATDTYPPASILVDDLVVVERAMPADEIRAVVESNAPVFAESSVFSWRAPSASPVWVDEEGLWVRTTDAVDVLGVYAGDATKSWGGLTLSTGDVLVGNNSDGYVWFDKDETATTKLKIKAEVDIEGNSTLNGTLDIASGGGLYVGNGSFASPYSGVKVWDPDGFGGVSAYYLSAEKLRLSYSGIDIESGGSISVDGPSSITWYYDVSTRLYSHGYIGAWFDGSTLEHVLSTGGYSDRSGYGARTDLRAESNGNYAQVQLKATPSGSSYVNITADTVTLTNALTVNGNVTLGDSSSDAHTVNGSLTLNDALTAKGSIALLGGSYPSDAFKGVYINNPSESYTSMHIVEDAWGASTLVSFGARYLSSATGDPSSNANWKTDYGPGSYDWGPGLIHYWGNGTSAGWRFHLSSSSGVDTNPSWSEVFRLRRDGNHAITGSLTITNALTVSGAATFSSTVDIAGYTSGSVTWEGYYSTSYGSTANVYKRARIVQTSFRIRKHYAGVWQPASYALICTVSSGYRPLNNIRISTVDTQGFNVVLELQTNGQLRLISATGAGGSDAIDLSLAYLSSS